jgi:hypothetical protein
MIPFLIDLPSLNSPMPATALVPQAAAPAGGARADFAGLLDAALPPPASLPDDSAVPLNRPVPSGDAPPAPPPATLLPGGTILPPMGKALPRQVQSAPASPPEPALIGTSAQSPRVPPAAMLPEAEDAAPAVIETLPDEEQQDKPAPAPAVPAAQRAEPALMPGFPAMPLPDAAQDSPVPQDAAPAALSLPAAPVVTVFASASAPASDPGLLAPQPLQMVLPAPAAVVASATIVPPQRREAAVVPGRAAVLPAVLKDMPADVVTPFSEVLAAPGEQLGAPATANATATSNGPAPAPALAQTIAAGQTASHPEPAAPAPPSAPAAAPQFAPAPASSERGDARVTNAPQLENAIAQVGELREALRAARPEMTLRHAEFGFVSLRLEATGADGWRAMLASRDPGFVPAIQTALAERALAVSASASADSSGMQAGTGQSGPGEQRYGSSPNGGQGTSQPYAGQSGQRDGEAAPDHRRPSTAAALAERAEEQEADVSPAMRKGGMFA